MTTSVAFFNNKGGVGKTTLLCNVAAYLKIHLKYKVLIIDADPQCNATQYLFSEETLEGYYEDASSFTINSVIKPLSLGKGYREQVEFITSPRFEVDILPGDPKLALTEDLLAKDWGAAIGGEARGIRTSLIFAELLSRCGDYDFVLFDVGPALGSINRAVLLASDYFLSPMSTDIFSIKAVENISTWLKKWESQWSIGVQNLDDPDEARTELAKKVEFAGYVTQLHTARKDSAGIKRAVNSYDKILSKFDKVVQKHLVGESRSSLKSASRYRLGSIPNLHSLVAMSQNSRAPIFELKSADGVVGAHFSKVKEAKDIIGGIAQKLVARVEA